MYPGGRNDGRGGMNILLNWFVTGSSIGSHGLGGPSNMNGSRSFLPITNNLPTVRGAGSDETEYCCIYALSKGLRGFIGEMECGVAGPFISTLRSSGELCLSLRSLAILSFTDAGMSSLLPLSVFALRPMIDSMENGRG